jgi:hypothetical protein
MGFRIIAASPGWASGTHAIGLGVAAAVAAIRVVSRVACAG